MKEKSLVVFGGKSVEHDISIITAMQMKRYLEDFVYVYIDKCGIWWIAENLDDIKTYLNFYKNAKKKRRVIVSAGTKVLLIEKHGKFSPLYKIKNVLNCCHGGLGEGGALQGLFDCNNISYSSPSVCSSAICMDKAFVKDILKANNILTPDGKAIKKPDFFEKKEEILSEISNLGFPIIVKPSNLGSSIGISVCKDVDDFADAASLAFEFDDKIVCEKVVENLREFNCACFCVKQNYFTSDVIEVENKSQIYSFEDKYISEETKSSKPNESLSKRVKDLTEKVYKLFDCEGIVRIDFLYNNKTKKLYVNELNTIPGSLSCHMFKDIDFKEVLTSVLYQAEEKSKNKQSLVATFDSDAISTYIKATRTFKK